MGPRMCGIIGIIGGKPVSPLLYQGLFAVQHRGQSSAGIITYDGNIHVTKDIGLVREVFNDEKKINKIRTGQTIDVWLQVSKPAQKDTTETQQPQ